MCDMCGRKFKARKDVWMHKLAKHGVLSQECDLPVFSCTECDKRFLRQDFYDRHLRTHPATPKAHGCDECPHRASTWSALVIHKRRRHRGSANADNSNDGNSYPLNVDVERSGSVNASEMCGDSSNGN